ncbi:hypothetical protein CBR_g1098 [Chara braunii]|uniref:DUF659 domain-containing protein n=1 Tax=Chara braunii TaxID=69332 RepID=A0A388KD58_CHABU|nr:hypothetical protein CBR_g1098 [Chara braunii]|eukprot:GBG67979.1 hypothetical protein CBR_g1098 [Chara braunii]
MGRIEIGPSSRRKWYKGEDEPRRKFVHMRYVSRLMEAVSARALIISLMTAVIGRLFAEWMETVTLGWTYNEPISGVLYKPAEVFRDFDLDQWEGSKGGCPCSSRYTRFTNPATKGLLESGRIGDTPGHHVITTDYTISWLPQLRAILHFGLNHIPATRLEIEVAVKEILKSFDGIMALYSKDYELQEEDLCRGRAHSRIPDGVAAGGGGGGEGVGNGEWYKTVDRPICEVMTEAEHEGILELADSRTVGLSETNDVKGIEDGGWERTSTPLGPYPGFVSTEGHLEYSTGFFDGHRHVVKGSHVPPVGAGSSGRAITETERHDGKLVVPKTRMESGLRMVLLGYADLVIFATKIDLHEEVVVGEAVEQIIRTGHRITVSDRIFVETAVIESEAESVVLLAIEQDRCTPWGRTRFDEALAEYLVNLAFKFLGFGNREAIWGAMLNTVVRFEPDVVLDIAHRRDAAIRDSRRENIAILAKEGRNARLQNKEIRDVDNVEFGIRLTKDVVKLSWCQDGNIDRRGGCKVRFAQQRNTRGGRLPLGGCGAGGRNGGVRLRAGLLSKVTLEGVGVGAGGRSVTSLPPRPPTFNISRGRRPPESTSSSIRQQAAGAGGRGRWQQPSSRCRDPPSPGKATQRPGGSSGQRDNGRSSHHARFIMAYLKQLHEDLKKHFINDGAAGSNPDKGSKHWVCKYYETRFDGTASALKNHFLNKCSLDHVRRPLSVEERARRDKGIRMGKFIAETIHAGGRSRPATNSLASVSSLVADAERGRTDSPGGAEEVVVADDPAAITPASGESCSLHPPFSIVDNEYFLEFVDVVKKAHPSCMPYKRDDARTKWLDGHYGRTKVDVHAMVKKWHCTGCMLQMDGWSDRRNRPYINVMVSSPIRAVFWKTTCMEGKDKDAAAYFQILDGVIKEIGEEAVVGVVMDNARVCVKAGKIVEAPYPRIFRLKVGKFFHNVDKAKALFHVYSPKSKLKRPGVTRFATNHEMLASLEKAKNPLKKCIDDAAWVEKMVMTDQLAAFHEVTAIVLGKEEFWATVNKALAVMGPVVTLLRLVDAPGPSMSKVYFKMDLLVARMHELDCITAGKKVEIEDILMRRWTFMTSELHCAVAFLDPEHRHMNALRDPEVRAGFNIWLLSWAPDDQQTRDELNHQVDMWVNLDGSFKSQDAAEAARVQPVALWWEAYCGKLDLLQPQAVKLLGQASSSAACERNWSLHELIFGRRHTKLPPERLAKLDDTPVEAEIREWYNTWIETAIDPAAVAADADVVAEDVEVGEEDGSELLMRTWQRNDVADDEECDEEDMALLGSLEREWHKCTKPGRRRKQDLRRRSGSSLPPPSVVYAEADRAAALKARLAGTWVEGRRESTTREKRVRKRARAAGEAGGAEAAVCVTHPKKKRG